MQRIKRIYLPLLNSCLAASKASRKEGLPSVVRLYGMPTPPTMNKSYINIQRGRALSSEAIHWQYELNAWGMENIEALAELQKMGQQQVPLGCECLFSFPRSDLYSKAGAVKKLDAPNFGKLLLDHLCTIAGFDDSLFFRNAFDKQVGPGRYVDMCIWCLPSKS